MIRHGSQLKRPVRTAAKHEASNNLRFWSEGPQGSSHVRQGVDEEVLLYTEARRADRLDQQCRPFGARTRLGPTFPALTDGAIAFRLFGASVLNSGNNGGGDSACSLLSGRLVYAEVERYRRIHRVVVESGE
jgi:hypothetical protein